MVFIQELCKSLDFSKHLRVVTSFVPGINSLDMEKLHESAEVSGLFMQGTLAAAQRCGRYRALPISYSGFVQHVRHSLEIDLAVVQVSPPDRDGLCSLGPAVEFVPVILRKALRSIALINRQTPALQTSVRFPYDSFDFVCEVDSGLPTYTTGSDPSTEAIAQSIAAVIADGSVIQLGLGKVPAALSTALVAHRRLRFHSGMLSDGFLALHEAGALDMGFQHTTCVVVGSRELYERIGELGPLRIIGCEVTHDASVIAAHGQFVAVNSAVEVDLFGQCNLEHIGGGAVSGMGGAPDFARAARASAGGISIVALNARQKSDSRIVSTLKSPSVATLPRCDVDYVITEYGTAKLVGKSVHERAEALIEVAAPEFRVGLSTEWDALAARL